MARALSSLELKVQEGRNEGVKEGLDKGVKEGLDKGRTESKSEIAMRLLRKGLDAQFVGEVTELSRDRIEQIQRELKGNQ